VRLLFTGSRQWSILGKVPTTSDFERQLRGATTDSIICVVRKDLGEVYHQSVYDVLRALTDAGLLRRAIADIKDHPKQTAR
jgi:Fur family transcriptional regulator, stress-responsive regulator